MLSRWAFLPDVTLIKPEVSFNPLFNVKDKETCEDSALSIDSNKNN